MPAINRYYSSNAVRTTTTASLISTDTSVAVAAVTGFPASTPFTMVLDEGQVSEEIVTVTAVAALTLTIARGQDGTSAVSHSLGAKAVHALTARDLREPQEHIAATTAVHGLVGAPAEATTLAAHTAATTAHGVTGNVVGTLGAQAIGATKTFDATPQMSVGLAFATSTSAANPSGQTLFSEGGSLKWRTPSGTVVTIVA